MREITPDLELDGETWQRFTALLLALIRGEAPKDPPPVIHAEDFKGLTDSATTLYELYAREGPHSAWRGATPIIAMYPHLARALTHAPEVVTALPAVPRVYPETALDKVQSPPLLYNAEGVQFPGAGLLLLAGQSGRGKSFLALHWALTLAQARQVVYVAAEKFNLYPERRRAWYKHHKRPNRDNAYWFDGPVNLMDELAVTRFLDAIADLSPALVVIDTLARCMSLGGGDENSARDMGKLVQGCERIMREKNCAVLLVHHTTKSGATERGSSALRGACDCVIELSGDDGDLTVACTKMSGRVEFEPVHFRLLPVELDGLDPDTGQPRQSCVVIPSQKVVTLPGQPLSKTQRQVLEALALEVFRDTGATSAKLREHLPAITAPTLYYTLSGLKRLGYLSQGTKGDPFTITEQGAKMLEQKEAL